nr:hypothetical protein [Tanacetum cinerariifolium]
SAAASASAVCAKMPVSSLPNVDSLSNVVVYSFFTSQSSSPQLDNEDLKQIDVDDLEEMDLRWQMAIMRARRFFQKQSKNLGANRPTSMGFDISKVECYNCHRKGHFARKCRSPKDLRRPGAAEPHRRTVPVETSTSNALVSQCDDVGSYDWSYQAEEEPANFTLMDFSSSSSSSDTESDCESWPPSSLYDRFQPSGRYHVVPPPTIGTFMPPKTDLVFHTAPIAVETDHTAFTVSDSEDEYETKAPQLVPSFVQSFEQVKTPRHSVQPVETSIPAATPKPASPKSNSSGKRRNIKACFVCKSMDHLIKDYNYHAKKMAQPTPRNYAHRGKMGMETKMLNSRPCFPNHKCINDPKKGNPKYALKDKGVIDSGCSRHMTWNMSYLYDFEELNGGYVAFGGNPKGGKISGKGKIKT